MAGVGVLERAGTDVPPHAVRAERPVGSARRWVPWGVLVLAAAGTALGLRGHAMWFDELQAWNIARASHSIPELYANLRYEGHPIVWYLPLYAITRFTGDPHAMQVLQWAIATCTFALILFRAPFAMWMRVALAGGYFFAFEYGVISRSYGLCALLALLAVCLLARPSPRWWAAAAALVVLSWTALPGAVLAVAIAAAAFLTDRTRWRWSALVTLAAGASALTCIPPPDFSSFAPGLVGDRSIFGSGPGVQLASATTGLWRGLVPIPSAAGKWNSNLLDGLPGAAFVEAALAVLLFVVVLRALRPFPFARRVWWIGSAGYVVFFLVVILPEQSRYAGFLFLLFLACAWLASSPPGAPGQSPIAVNPRANLLGAVFVVVLAAQVIATVAMYPPATVDPFSRAEEMAQVVHRARLDDAVVSVMDFDGATVGGYLDRPVYSVTRQAWIHFFLHDQREAAAIDHLTNHEAVCAAVQVARARGGAAALIGYDWMRDMPVIRRLPVLARVGGAVIYRVEPDAAIVGRC
jgi:hypothetical protein